MNTGVSVFDNAHHLGEPAARPVTRLPGRLAALHPRGVRQIRKPPKAATTLLLLLAGNDHARRRALPAAPAGPHSGAFNREIKVER